MLLPAGGSECYYKTLILKNNLINENMERLEELNIILTKLNYDFTKLKIYDDGSGINSVIEHLEEIRKYQIERFKITNPNEPIRDSLIQKYK